MAPAIFTSSLSLSLFPPPTSARGGPKCSSRWAREWGNDGFGFLIEKSGIFLNTCSECACEEYSFFPFLASVLYFSIQPDRSIVDRKLIMWGTVLKENVVLAGKFNANKTFYFVSLSAMEFHEHLQSIGTKEGLKERKLQKAVESFTWNITILKVVSLLTYAARCSLFWGVCLKPCVAIFNWSQRGQIFNSLFYQVWLMPSVPFLSKQWKEWGEVNLIVRVTAGQCAGLVCQVHLQIDTCAQENFGKWHRSLSNGSWTVFLISGPSMSFSFNIHSLVDYICQ